MEVVRNLAGLCCNFLWDEAGRLCAVSLGTAAGPASGWINPFKMLFQTNYSSLHTALHHAIMSEEIFFHLHKFAWNSHIYLSIHYRIWTLNYPQLFSGYADVCVYGIDGDCGGYKNITVWLKTPRTLQLCYKEHCLIAERRLTFARILTRFIFFRNMPGRRRLWATRSTPWWRTITKNLLHLSSDALLSPSSVCVVIIIVIDSIHASTL